MPSTYTPNPSGQEKFRQAIEAAANAGITRGAVALEGFAKRGIGKGGRFNHAAPGQPPNTQRGGLRNSITHTESRHFRASAGTNIAYGLTQERGGVIRAKRGFLPVPLNVQAERLLEQFGRTTEYFQGQSGTGYLSRGGLRQVPGLTIIKSKSGALLLVGKRAVKGTRKFVGLSGVGYVTTTEAPAFVLKKYITIRPHPWLMPALNNNRQAIGEAVTKAAARSMASQGFGRGGIGGAIR